MNKDILGESNLLAAKYILEDMLDTDRIAFMDMLTPAFGIPVDMDGADFLDLVYHGSAMELLQAMFLLDAPVGEHIYELVLNLAEARLDPDEESGEMGVGTQEENQN